MLDNRSLRSVGAAALVTLALVPVTGCKKPVDDATLTTNVHSALSGDSVIASQPVQVAVLNGVVTLTGNVSDETASSLAASDAAKVAGVKEVVNSLTVAGLAVTPTIISPSAPSVPRLATPSERAVLSAHESLPPPPANAPAPPQPVFHDVTVAAGRDIPVRITESFDSETAQPGTRFSGVLTRPIIADGFVAVPAGASVHGTLTDAKDATHYKGSSLLVLRLDSIQRHGERIDVAADPFVVEGKGRGTNTAEKVGGGALAGALIGGLLGRGKGAAIGAGVGAGGGVAVQGFTRGQQVHVASESIIRFRLTNSFTVHTAEEADSQGDNQGEPVLHSH